MAAKVAIAKAIEDEIKAQGERRGGDTSLGIQSNPQNFEECKGKETIEIAAEKAGFNNKETYRQAKKVINEAIPEIIDKMDAGILSVNAADQAAIADVLRV